MALQQEKQLPMQPGVTSMFFVRSPCMSADVTLGDRLRVLRATLNVTQQALADRAGLQQATIARLETGGRRPRESTLKDISDALGVSVTALDDDRACLEEIARLMGVQLRAAAPSGRLSALLERVGPDRAEYVLQMVEAQVGMLLGGPLPAPSAGPPPVPSRAPEPPPDEDDDEPPDRPRPRAGSPSARGDR